MLVKASADGKTLLQSGSFHSIINPLVPSEPLKLVYDGLTILITTKILPESESNKQGVDAFVKNGEVVFVHRVIVAIMNEAVGLVIPAEIGKKSNGKKLFMAWHSNIREIGTDQISVIVNFSFYEGE